ncbi:hypothetical protein [Mycolicibacterium sediminis]|uniref:Uncharacterized protein n=1 Tax=Mycolicibacterium sediminis TaxID=1286180 RepID=A0A7I7QQK5_9MYCO|nr:hypothetical protein [Mycolicibacterium sediminis]BBY28663.1 hypothetical protein MSEDJ_27590 [Mycolicibacterium sediminis]
MSSLLPNDDAYHRVKRIRQGVGRLEPIFDDFVDRFERRFGFAPLSLTTDALKPSVKRASAPRLGVVLERTEQYRSFLEAGRGYDPTKQRLIAQMFVGALVGVDLLSVFGMPGKYVGSEDFAGEIFVHFSDFERLAKIETHSSLTPAELEHFTASLGLGDQLWCIRSLWGPPVVFVHTATQAVALQASAVPERWADEYFSLVTSHDEFGYLGRSEITIAVDSKENFDRNYASNWYYYFK